MSPYSGERLVSAGFMAVSTKPGSLEGCTSRLSCTGTGSSFFSSTAASWVGRGIWVAVTFFPDCFPAAFFHTMGKTADESILADSCGGETRLVAGGGGCGDGTSFLSCPQSRRLRMMMIMTRNAPVPQMTLRWLEFIMGSYIY